MDQSRMRQQKQQQRGIPARQSRVSDAYLGAGGDADDEDYEEERYDFDDTEPPRLPTSVRRYQVRTDVKGNVGRLSGDVQTTGDALINQRSTNIPRRATQTGIPTVSTGPSRRQSVNPTTAGGFDGEEYGQKRRHFHWLFFVGLAMFTMLIGWVLLTTVANWWQVTQDDWHYGRPRTYQVDVVVGHNDAPTNPSHFIAVNLRGQVEIIEFPGGDATKAKMYMGPHLMGPGEDLAPATLTFQDVNGDGKLDMIVNVQGSHFIFLNNGTGFRPAPGS